MTPAEIAIVAALVGSAPGWAGVWIMSRSNQKRFDKQDADLAEQTSELKQHVTDALTGAVAGEKGA